MSDTPADLRYTSDHLWVSRRSESQVRIGVTDFAQQSLGDVVEVSPPGPGTAIEAGQACGDIESVKSVSDLIAPVSATVSDKNGSLASAPELVNSDPYGEGWMFDAEAEPSVLNQQLAELLDASAYRALTGE